MSSFQRLFLGESMITINCLAEYFGGVCLYEVCVDGKRVATFKHDRRDGLPVCLHKASNAVEQKRWATNGETK